MPARQSASSGQPALAQSGFAVFTGGQHGISAMSTSAMSAGSATGIASCPTPTCAITDARMPATAAGAATGVRARLRTARSGISRRRASQNVTDSRCQLFGPGGRPSDPTASEVPGGTRRPLNGRAPAHLGDRPGRRADLRRSDRTGRRSMRLGYEAGRDVVHPPRERITWQCGKHCNAGEDGKDLGSHGGTRSLLGSSRLLSLSPYVPRSLLRHCANSFSCCGRRREIQSSSPTALVRPWLVRYHRSRRGPRSAPASVHSAMVPPYQTATNGTVSSMQCRE